MLAPLKPRPPPPSSGPQCSRVVFVFDLAPALWGTPQNPQFGTRREYVVAGGCNEHSTRPFRPNARWLIRAFAHLLRTVRGHCAPLQFLIGGAETGTVATGAQRWRP